MARAHAQLIYKHGFKTVITTLPHRILSAKKAHVFFGYYDVTPLSRVDNLCLAVRVEGDNLPPVAGQIADVGYFDLDDENAEFIKVDETPTWSWQQSCRLQWFPAIRGGENRQVLYNTRRIDGSRAVIQNIETGQIVQSFKRPIYAVDREGTVGFSLSFGRLHQFRPGYGYAGEEGADAEIAAPNDDGLWRLDLKKSAEKLVLTLKDAAHYKPHQSMRGANHYFNHVLVSPGGVRALFFHLWEKDGKKAGRIFTVGLDGNNLYLLTNSGHASHYCWDGDEHIICYSSPEAKKTQIYRYKDQTQEYEPLLDTQVTRDTHMSLASDKHSLLVDSYPDKYRLQSLALCDIRFDTGHNIAAFYAPLSFRGEIRCDLHPRFDPSCRKVIVDHVHKGNRVLNVLDLG